MKIKEKLGWKGMGIVSLIVIVVLMLWFFVFGIYSHQSGSFFNKGHNAVWISHDWVGEDKSDADIINLVNTLKKHQIDTVFVHAGPFDSDGTIDPKTYQYSISFVERAKKLDQNIKYQAWLGQVRNKLDLGNKIIRHNIVNQTVIMSLLVGFDGIHFDIEPVWDRDMEFITLLKETREAIPKGKIISVAMAEFIPNSIVWITENIHKFKNYNTQVNYKNVAQYADQIVVMAYDTGIKKPWLYRWLVEEQTIWLTNLLNGKEVFIAIPSYDEQTDEFDPKAENIQNGLEGIISGLNNIRSNEKNFAGVAIYPFWKIDDKEWQIYNDLWLK